MRNLLFKTFDKGHYVLLLKVAQHLDFTKGRLLNDFIVVGLLELLNGDYMKVVMSYNTKGKSESYPRHLATSADSITGLRVGSDPDTP